MAKLLIIEDDLLLARMYQKSFGLAGFEILHADNGDSGVELARAHKPDIILLDVMMPKVNGFEALDRLKVDPLTAQVPVIILTNLGNEEDAENALSKGAARYLIKSEHEPADVVSLVKETLSQYGQKTT